MGKVKGSAPSPWLNGVPAESVEFLLTAILVIQMTLHTFPKDFLYMCYTSLRDDVGPVGLDPSASVYALHLVTL